MTEYDLAPGVAALLAMDKPPAEDLDQIRQAGRDAAAFWTEGSADVPIRDIPCGDQMIRLYQGGDGTGPILVYIHGGGWVMGSVAENDPFCRRMAAVSGCHVASLSYRLAPEHPYPAALGDCRGGLAFVADHAGELGHNGQIVLGGASAGGNLALSAALAGGRTLAGLLLIYGVFGLPRDTGSYAEFTTAGLGLTGPDMQYFFDAYDPTGARHSNLLITPSLAEDAALAALPPVHMTVAKLDVLRDDSLEMAARMRAVGVDLSLDLVPGVPHGFINRGRLIPRAHEAIDRAADFTRRFA